MQDEIAQRGFTTGSESFDPETNIIEVIFASGTPVRRNTWDGPFDEVLEISKDAIDSTRMNTGSMSILDNHAAIEMSDRMGVVLADTLRIDGGKAYCKVKLSKDRAATLIADLKNGMPFAVSVGYKIHEFSSDDEADIPQRKVTRWEPVEISAVPVPADPAAQTRKENSMPKEINQSIDQDELHTIEDSTENLSSIRKERKRCLSIQSLADRFDHMSDNMAELSERAISNGTSVETFREMLHEKQVERSQLMPVNIPLSYDQMVAGNSSKDELAARAEALACRITGKEPSSNARNYMNMTIGDHARGFVESRGESTRTMGPDQILRRAHATGDFPLLLKATGHRVLVENYQLAQSPLKNVIARRSSIDDFRAKSILKISDIGQLKKVNEGGEITATTRSETTEGYALETFARMFKITRQALINDDLGAFADFNRTAGRMAAETENQLLFDLLTQSNGAGVTLQETNKSMFHADHNNLSTGASSALSATSLSHARKLMRQQKALDGNTFVNAAPKFLMVGPELETTAEQLVASITANSVDEVNPFSHLQLIVEPRIENLNWYLFADPAVVPVLEYSYLSSQPGVQIDVEDSFDTLGTSFRAYLDFGAGGIDYRGAHRAVGAA
jgi:hypothetical protein